jgi:GNAT superfamily N-acetyltransferase
VGYFVIQAYDDGDVEVLQGYLIKDFRHIGIHKAFMTLLEDILKRAGFKKVLLGTHSRFKAYLGFAKDLGYKPEHLTFSKEL